MNHVAHCFLSYADPDSLFGNFIGDYVKGKRWEEFPQGIQKGILLHRAIDAFTDEHPVTRRSIARLRPYAGRYAAPVVDILYDHLLCRHWALFAPDLPFDHFAAWAYDSLGQYEDRMPESLRRRWPQMRDGRFLHGYAHRAGMEWVMGMFSRRLAGSFDPEIVSTFFFDEIEAFSGDFKAFFPDLVAHARAFHR